MEATYNVGECVIQISAKGIGMAILSEEGVIVHVFIMCVTCSNMKSLIPMFGECVDTFLNQLRPLADGKTQVPMIQHFSIATVDVISKVIKLFFCLLLKCKIGFDFLFNAVESNYNIYNLKNYITQFKLDKSVQENLTKNCMHSCY